MWARTPQERIFNIDKEIEALLLKLNKGVRTPFF